MKKRILLVLLFAIAGSILCSGCGTTTAREERLSIDQQMVFLMRKNRSDRIWVFHPGGKYARFHHQRSFDAQQIDSGRWVLDMNGKIVLKSQNDFRGYISSPPLAIMGEIRNKENFQEAILLQKKLQSFIDDMSGPIPMRNLQSHIPIPQLVSGQLAVVWSEPWQDLRDRRYLHKEELKRLNSCLLRFLKEPSCREARAHCMSYRGKTFLLWEQHLFWRLRSLNYAMAELDRSAANNVHPMFVTVLLDKDDASEILGELHSIITKDSSTARDSESEEIDGQRSSE